MARAGVVEQKPEQDQGAATSSPYRAAIAAFADVAGGLAEFRDLDSLLHLIASKICELAGISRCSVYLREDGTGLFRGQVGHADHDIDARVKRLVSGMEADAFTREVVEGKKPVAVVNTLEDDRPMRAAMRAWNVRSMLGVPMVLHDEVIGIIYLDDEDRQHTFSEADQEVASAFADLAAVAISQAQVTEQLRSSLRTVARQNDLLRRAAALDDRLAGLVLEGGSVAEIAEAVAEVTGKPCSIHDESFQRLTAAVPPGLGDAAIPRLLDPAHHDHPVVREALESLRGKPSGVIGPFPQLGLSRRYLVAPMTMRQLDSGYLVLGEHGTRFHRLDMHFARRAAMNVALELAAEQRAVRADVDARASLLSELIRGNRDLPSIERRAQHLGVDLTKLRVLCLVSNDSANDSFAHRVAPALREATDGSILASGVAEGVVVAIELEGGQPTLAAVSQLRARIEAAVEQLGEPGLVAAVSTRCRTVPDYVKGYAECRQVLSVAKRLSSPEGRTVLTADDLGPGRLFLASSNRTEAEQFSQDALGPLLAMEDGGETGLVGTLASFFACGRSVRRSAQALGVHENTIRYRLGRIQELTGLDVASSSDDQLTAQTALLILRIQGRIPAHVASVAADA
jgi:sugar diacid utilization regulator/GAF domain-containing protein